MRLRHRIAVLVGSFAIAHSVMPAHAVCPTLRIDDEFKRSTAVFVGRAIAQSIATTPTLNWPRATETTFAVESVWKGEPDATIRVRVCGGAADDGDMSCGEDFRFVVGSRYVVFADGRPLTTNNCHHTALLDRAGQSLEWLSHKPQKRVRTKGAEPE